MSKEEKKKLVPKLRFPEFKESGEWKEKRLAELGELVPGLTYSPDDVRENGLLVLRSSNVQKGQITLEDCVYVTPDIKGANLSQPGDILICVRNGSKALIGKNAIIPKGMPLSTHGAFMTVFRSPVPNFVFQLFQTDVYDQQVGGDLGATINSINGNNFLKYKFSVPTNPAEQQKIADCLSSLDDLMRAQSNKLEALKAHKKGLMQNLFPAEGETVPRLRFPEFRESGEWLLEPIGKKIDFLSGYAFKGTEISEDSTGTRLLRGINITEGRLRHSNDIDRFFLGDEEKLTKFKVQENDLVIAMDGSKVGKNTAIVTAKDEGALLVQRVARLRTGNPGTIQYIFQHINSVKFHRYVDKINTSSGIPHISSDQINNFQISFPPSEKEQQKIASCLSSLDVFMTAQTEELEALMLHKKGLMQGLFPELNGGADE